MLLLPGKRADGWQYGDNTRTQRKGWFPVTYTEDMADYGTDSAIGWGRQEGELRTCLYSPWKGLLHWDWEHLSLKRLLGTVAVLEWNRSRLPWLRTIRLVSCVLFVANCNRCFDTMKLPGKRACVVGIVGQVAVMERWSISFSFRCVTLTVHHIFYTHTLHVATLMCYSFVSLFFASPLLLNVLSFLYLYSSLALPS